MLQKIRWCRLGSEQSDRQWRDICSILRISNAALDFDYLRSTAAAVDLMELLVRAEHDAMN